MKTRILVAAVLAAAIAIVPMVLCDSEGVEPRTTIDKETQIIEGRYTQLSGDITFTGEGRLVFNSGARLYIDPTVQFSVTASGTDVIVLKQGSVLDIGGRTAAVPEDCTVGLDGTLKYIPDGNTESLDLTTGGTVSVNGATVTGVDGPEYVKTVKPTTIEGDYDHTVSLNLRVTVEEESVALGTAQVSIKGLDLTLSTTVHLYRTTEGTTVEEGQEVTSLSVDLVLDSATFTDVSVGNGAEVSGLELSADMTMDGEKGTLNLEKLKVGSFEIGDGESQLSVSGLSVTGTVTGDESVVLNATVEIGSVTAPSISATGIDARITATGTAASLLPTALDATAATATVTVAGKDVALNDVEVTMGDAGSIRLEAATAGIKDESGLDLRLYDLSMTCSMDGSVESATASRLEAAKPIEFLDDSAKATVTVSDLRFDVSEDIKVEMSAVAVDIVAPYGAYGHLTADRCTGTGSMGESVSFRTWTFEGFEYEVREAFGWDPYRISGDFTFSDGAVVSGELVSSGTDQLFIDLTLAGDARFTAEDRFMFLNLTVMDDATITGDVRLGYGSTLTTSAGVLRVHDDSHVDVLMSFDGSVLARATALSDPGYTILPHERGIPYTLNEDGTATLGGSAGDLIVNSDPKTFTVTFEGAEPMEYACGDTVPLMTPSREGYVLGGWHAGTSYIDISSRSFVMPDHDVRLTPVWLKNLDTWTAEGDVMVLDAGDGDGAIIYLGALLRMIGDMDSQNIGTAEFRGDYWTARFSVDDLRGPLQENGFMVQISVLESGSIYEHGGNLDDLSRQCTIVEVYASEIIPMDVTVRVPGGTYSVQSYDDASMLESDTVQIGESAEVSFTAPERGFYMLHAQAPSGDGGDDALLYVAAAAIAIVAVAAAAYVLVIRKRP